MQKCDKVTEIIKGKYKLAQ